MFELLVLAIGVHNLVLADVSLGYHYKRPQNLVPSVVSTVESPTYISPLYGVPKYQISSGSGQYSSGHADANSNYNEQGFSKLLGLNYGTYNTFNKLQNNGAYRGSDGYQPVNLLGNIFYQNELTSNPLPTYPVSSSNANKGLQTFNNQYYQSTQYQNSEQKYQQSFQVQQQPAQVFKHFYVHAAPEDNEPPKQRKPVILPPPQKHYKIIFIKTPSLQQSAPQVLPVQQNEEKTIVYVLVKKPEDVQDVVIPKADQKPPTKPEVFFIKYNNKEDSQSVIDNIVKDYNKGQSISFSNPSVSNEAIGNSDVFSGQTYQPNITPPGFQTLGLNNGAPTLPSSIGSQSFGIVTGPPNNQNNAPAGTESFSLTSNDESVQSQIAPDFGTSTFGTLDTQNQALPIFGSAPLGITGLPSAVPTTVTTASSAGSKGYDNSVSNGVTSSGVADSSANTNYNNLSTVPTSQGVPHETYGIPKFRI
ncbi:uncharacterized protein DDB_G0283357-like [Achroia grisella]|uniref:uncharacterized protein DDB_G0283357-like n=1 Tax=Achroia grisella TaxID=688607 RepID=UPI0027D28063|nr:uncharacterized protein DDB_G0283357-like [Achroia grisella]